MLHDIGNLMTSLTSTVLWSLPLAKQALLWSCFTYYTFLLCFKVYHFCRYVSHLKKEQEQYDNARKENLKRELASDVTHKTDKVKEKFRQTKDYWHRAQTPSMSHSFHEESLRQSFENKKLIKLRRCASPILNNNSRNHKDIKLNTFNYASQSLEDNSHSSKDTASPKVMQQLKEIFEKVVCQDRMAK